MGRALVGLLCLAPLGMAAGAAAEQTPGASSAQVQPPSTTRPRAQGAARMTATVEGVEQRKGTLNLRAADGDRLEFKVPKGLLASLQEGDRGQIGMQKVPGTPARSPTRGTARPQPEQPK
jgi:hypothetical protein